MKLEIQNYHPKTTDHVKLYLDATTLVVWMNTQFATHCKLSFSVRFLLLKSHRWTDFDDLYTYVIWHLATPGCVLCNHHVNHLIES